MGAFQGALKKAGASPAIVDGIFPATAPLLAVGCVAAAIRPRQENWPAFGAAIALALIACISAFAGPINVWLFMGVGLFPGGRRLRRRHRLGAPRVTAHG